MMFRPSFAWICLPLVLGYLPVSAQPTTARILWQQSYESVTAKSVDRGRAMTVDATGNVYVAGSVERLTGTDILTMKFSASGASLWSAYYDGPGRAFDIPAAIAVNDFGDVFVTGFSQGMTDTLPDLNDIVTIKYDPSGHEQWVRRYDGGRNDAAETLVASDDGGVVVAGTTVHTDWNYPNYGSDIITIKYNASGDIAWMHRREADPREGMNYPTKLLRYLDGSIVLVASLTDSTITYPNWFRTVVTGVEAIRFSPDGSVQWVNHVASTRTSPLQAVDAALSQDGVLCVTGTRAGNQMFTMASTMTGDPLWSDSLVGFNARPTAIAADPSGNFIVTGAVGRRAELESAGDSIVTIKYNSNGVRAWIRFESALVGKKIASYSVCSTPAGEIVIGGGAGRNITPDRFIEPDDILLLKYSQDGTFLWREPPGIPPSVARVVTLAPGGNICVTGWAGAQRETDIFVAEFAPTGQDLWSAQRGGKGSANDNLAAMVTDPEGNTYVTGSSENGSAFTDLFAAKYTPRGELEWSVVYDGPAHHYDAGAALTLNTQGDLFVAGTSGGANGRSDIVTICYSAKGEQRWINRYDGVVHGDDCAAGIACDKEGNVFVIGTANGRMVTISYDPVGQLRWIANRDSGSGSTSVRIDPWGDVIATSEGRTVKYSNRGEKLWSCDGGYEAAVDEAGNVYVANDITGVLKVDRAGTVQWTRHLSSVRLAISGYQDLTVFACSPLPTIFRMNRDGAILWRDTLLTNQWPVRFAVDPGSTVYVAGRTESQAWGIGNRFELWRIASSGKVQWKSTFPLENAYAFDLQGVSVDASGIVTLAGTGQRWNNTGTTHIMKIRQLEGGGVGDVGSAVEVHLRQNYPNPFNPSTRITYEVTGHGFVTLKIYDVLGREVTTLVGGYLDPGTYSVTWNGTNGSGLPVGNGVYFSRVSVGRESSTRSMILLK